MYIFKPYKIILLLSILFTSLFSQELKKVTLQLSWFDQFQFAGYYMAKEKGFYKELGLDVEIKPFAFGLNISQDVQTQKTNFAIGRETLILDKSNGSDIVALYALFQASPLILMTTEESGISKIKDFVNKKVMTTIDDASEVSIKAMISSHKIKLEDLHFLKHSHNINDLIEKKTDVISAYVSKSPYVLEKKGIDFNTFAPKDYGFDMYSDLLYTSSFLVKNDFSTVVSFKNASLKGWEYAYSNIEESVDLILEKYNFQKLSKEELLFEAKELKKLSYFENNDLGDINKEKLQRIFDLYNIMGLTKENIDFDKFVFDYKSNIKFNEEELAYLSKKESIKYCVVPKSLPYSDIKDGELNGSLNSFINALQEKIPTKFELVETDSYSESLNFLKASKCEFIPSIHKTPKRLLTYSFSDKYLEIPAVIMTKNNRPFIENLNDLNDVVIGITKGLGIYEILKDKYPNIKFTYFDTFSDGIESVKNNVVYGYISSLATAWHLIQKESLTDIVISGKLDEKIEFYIGVNKSDSTLNSILNKALLSVDKNVMTKIDDTISYVDANGEFNYKLLLQLFALVLLVLFFLLYRQLLLSKLNKKLNLIVKEKTQELEKINLNLEKKVEEKVKENLEKDRLIQRQSKLASMGEMLENIAHQWRQPLGVISVGVSSLKLKKDMNDLDDETFDIITTKVLESTQYLSKTIDDFRFFFKPNKKRQKFLVKESIEKCISLVSLKFYEEKIEFIVDIDSLEINTFESELMQVIINILNNAKDALCSNETIQKKYIFISVEKSEKETVIKIKDNAGGIDESIIEKIFEPYFTTKHKSQGTGIGLYMCDEIVKKYMNGNLEVFNVDFEYENVKYRGAEFNIRLFNEK